MILCALDVEATGLDVEKDHITEIGYIIYDPKVHKPYKLNSDLIHIPEDVKLTPENFKVTGITRGHVDSGIPIEQAIEQLHEELDFWKVDYIVAHNAEYDRAMVERVGFRKMSWLCTMEDIDYDPVVFKSRNLTFVAGTLGFVNMYAHASLFDAVTCKRVLDHFDLENVIARSKLEYLYLKADVTFNTKELAKQAKYRWDGEKKIWWKKVKEDKLDAEYNLGADIGFKISRLPKEFTPCS